MSWFRPFLGLVLVAGCTKDNPRACGPGDPCTDPAFPFCDIDGIVGDLPGDCLAVDCMPGDFVACNADQALQCNATGDNYQAVGCERGCDPLSDGCRLCSPNETACTNGVTATCDANGAVVDMTPCPLGCFESEPRCRQVDPSNGLAMYLDTAATGPDVTAVEDLIFNVETGTVYSFDTGALLAVPSFERSAPAGGARIRVFVFHAFSFAGRLIIEQDGNTQPAPALAIVSATELIVGGQLDASAYVQRQFEDGYLGPGSLVSGPCIGEQGTLARRPGPIDYVSGAGGGGNATPGSHGGSVALVYTGGAGGAVHGNENIEPLVGGCAGGGIYNEFTNQSEGAFSGAGGGAVQLVAGTRIVLGPGASVLANGAGGNLGQTAGAGGGAGGSILLEAPSIELMSGSALTANGGSGGGGDGGFGSDGLRSESPAPAYVPPPMFACAPPALCGASGAGGSVLAAPTDGEEIGFDGQNDGLAAGGGGGMGRTRLNTRDMTFTTASDVILSPVPSSGTVRTR